MEQMLLGIRIKIQKYFYTRIRFKIHIHTPTPTHIQESGFQTLSLMEVIHKTFKKNKNRIICTIQQMLLVVMLVLLLVVLFFYYDYLENLDTVGGLGVVASNKSAEKTVAALRRRMQIQIQKERTYKCSLKLLVLFQANSWEPFKIGFTMIRYVR